MQILLYNIFVQEKYCIGDFLEDTMTAHQEKKHRSETKIYAGIMKWYLHFAGVDANSICREGKMQNRFRKVYDKQELLLIVRCCM